MNEPLKIVDVVDRGYGGKERITIRVNLHCDLGHYWLGAGVKQSQNEIFPLNDNLFWFGRGLVQPGDWIFLYTGIGTPQTNKIPGQTGHIYTLHWQKQNVLFKSDQVFPYLINATVVGLPEKFDPPALPSFFAQPLLK